MPSIPLSYKTYEATITPITDKAIDIPSEGTSYQISTWQAPGYGKMPRYYLECRYLLGEGNPDEDGWGNVENIEGKSETSCDFLLEINTVFNSEFMCSDAGWDCREDNPDTTPTCKDYRPQGR